MLARVGVSGVKRVGFGLKSLSRDVQAPICEPSFQTPWAASKGSSGQQAVPSASCVRPFSCGGSTGPSSPAQPAGASNDSSRSRAASSQSRRSGVLQPDLHERLAALWGMPAELLFERQQAIARILGPAGCDTSAHALWVLVRSPQLRHASEASLRASLRQLHRLAAAPELDRAALLTAVYRHPWIVSAMAASQQPPAAGAGAGPDANTDGTSSSSSSSTTPAAAVQQDDGSSSSSAISGSSACHTWKQELAAVILDRHASAAGAAADARARGNSSSSSGSPGGGGWALSPTFAAAAVRGYVAAAEVAQAVGGCARRLLHAVSVSGAAQAPAGGGGGQAQASLGDGSGEAAPAAAAGGEVGSGGSGGGAQQEGAGGQHPDGTAMGEVLTRLQAQHQQHLLLQQLLAACPPLVALPPELLLARWQHLLSVLAGRGGAAAQLVTANAYLMLRHHDDVPEWRQHAQQLRASYA